MLSRGQGAELLARREFALWFEDGRVWRYKSYASADELRAAVLEHAPVRLEVGAVYQARPEHGGAVLGKELVFDVDLPDYGAARHCACAAEKRACAECWRVQAAAAAYVLDRVLRDSYGLEQLRFVYSGRKGLHVWVLDEEAFRLSDAQRAAVVAFMQEPLKRAAVPGGLLPNVASPHCVAMLMPELRRRFLAQVFDQLEAPAIGAGPLPLESDALQRLWPRVDAAVTSRADHLVKLPFVVHPATGAVARAFRLEDVERQFEHPLTLGAFDADEQRAAVALLAL